MRLLLNLAVSLTLVCPAFAYPEEQKLPPFSPQDIKQIILNIKSTAQVFKIIEAASKPGEFADFKKAMAGYGVTEKSVLPKMNVDGTRVSFEGLKGEFDLKDLLAGKVGLGKNIYGFGAQRPMIENLKGIVEFYNSGTVRHALLEVLLPVAHADDIETGTAAGSLVLRGAGLLAMAGAALLGIFASSVLIAGSVAVTALVAVLVGIFGAISYFCGDSLSGWGRRNYGTLGLYLDCDEDNDLVLKKFPGTIVDGFALEDYTGPVERQVRKTICKPGRIKDAFNRGIKKYIEAYSAAAETEGGMATPAGR